MNQRKHGATLDGLGASKTCEHHFARVWANRHRSPYGNRSARQLTQALRSARAFEASQRAA
jgi:hypothetical protein